MKYIKRQPVEVEALQFTGNNFNECKDFIGEGNYDNTVNYPNIIIREEPWAVNKDYYIVKWYFKGEIRLISLDNNYFETQYEPVI
jgi:hypothetical protein